MENTHTDQFHRPQRNQTSFLDKMAHKRKSPRLLGGYAGFIESKSARRFCPQVYTSPAKVGTC